MLKNVDEKIKQIEKTRVKKSFWYGKLLFLLTPYEGENMY